GIFAETDANTLVKTGVPVEEIIASLFEAVVYQNLATLTKGNTPLPEVLLLGGPNLFFRGLQEAWRHHLAKLWTQRKIELPEGRTAADLILVPTEALYYACLGCVEIGRGENRQVGEAGFTNVAGLALTGYGKDLLVDVLGADVGVVETVAHATAALHYYSDADVICDVGGTDVKIMILRQGTVADFRLNSQCSSGNGSFLQGVAERYNIPL